MNVNFLNAPCVPNKLKGLKYAHAKEISLGYHTLSHRLGVLVVTDVYLAYQAANSFLQRSPSHNLLLSCIFSGLAAKGNWSRLVESQTIVG